MLIERVDHMEVKKLRLADYFDLSQEGKDLLERELPLYVTQLKDWQDYNTKEVIGTKVTLSVDRSSEYAGSEIEVKTAQRLDSSYINEDVSLKVKDASFYARSIRNNNFGYVVVTVEGEIEKKNSNLSGASSSSGVSA